MFKVGDKVKVLKNSMRRGCVGTVYGFNGDRVIVSFGHKSKYNSLLKQENLEKVKS